MTAMEAADPANPDDRAHDDTAQDLAALQRYGSALLERAVGFGLAALDALPPLTAAELARPTACAGWNLEMLLLHLDDSLAALNEAVTEGSVRLLPDHPDGPRDLIGSLREGARRLAAAWTDADREGRVVMVAGCALRAGVVACVGALEIVVHVWDVGQALGAPVRIPDALAERLLRVAPLLIQDHARDGLFGSPVPVPPDAPPGDRLVAFLGRDPRRAVA
jgi:uncharacterized protein (TIGR03086 family)